MIVYERRIVFVLDSESAPDEIARPMASDIREEDY